MIHTNMLRQNAIWLLVFLGFCGSAFSSATAQNEYVVLSVDSANVNSILVAENAFFGTVCLENLETTALIRIQARPGYRLLSESEFTMKLGGSHTYKVQATSGKEEAAQGDIILPKVDIRFEELTELTEETTNVYIGYAKCSDGYDSEPCRGRLRPVSISASPTDKPAGADIQLSFPDGQLLEQTEDGFKVAGQSYPVAEIASKHFFLHGHTPSESVRDCTLKAVHSVSKSEDVLRYSVVHATFEVESDDHNPNSGRDLTDNRTAKVTIQLHGFDPSEKRNFVLHAEPKKKENIVNKCGTDITFSKTDDPLVWTTSKIYWYGNNPDRCCNTNESPYLFSLEVDNAFCASTNEYTVGWPNENPKMKGGVSPLGVFIIHDAELVPGETNRFRCRIEIHDFQKNVVYQDCPASQQYADEILKEEEYHAKQWLGQVPSSQGGLQEYYTANGIKLWAGFSGDGPYYVYGDTAEKAMEKGAEIGRCSIKKEMRASCVAAFLNDPFRELKAKEYVGYNAAWKYHCSYSGKTKTFEYEGETFSVYYPKNPQYVAPERNPNSCNQSKREE
ncbi:MAG: hypothetical protein ACI4QT_01315 [Kiritimatiellia bacterium]